MSLSIMTDSDGGRSLLPWFPIHLNRHTLMYHNLCVREEGGREGREGGMGGVI